MFITLFGFASIIAALVDCYILIYLGSTNWSVGAAAAAIVLLILFRRFRRRKRRRAAHQAYLRELRALKQQWAEQDAALGMFRSLNTAQVIIDIREVQRRDPLDRHNRRRKMKR
jgi:flagellar biosynthesis/type III secretory pathway M-ring protein FliF/YscJ